MNKIIVKYFNGVEMKESYFEDISKATKLYESLQEDTAIKSAELSIVVKTILTAFNR